MSEALVWCEPQERKNMSLVQGDVGRAIAWFGEVTGQQPELIMVHPTNEQIARENSNGIKVQTLGGVLASEVWLSPTEHFGTKKSPNFQIGNFSPNQNLAVPKLRHTSSPLGRPVKDLPTEKILQLHSQGVDIRSIAKRLREDGVSVSRSTIHRVIKKEQTVKKNNPSSYVSSY